MQKTEPDLADFLTTGEVADRYGITQHEVQRAIHKGLIQAQRVGYFYLIWGPALPTAFPATESA